MTALGDPLDQGDQGRRAPADLRQLLAACMEGRLYLDLARACGLACEEEREIKRTKRLAFKEIFFGPVREGKQLWREFQALYSSVAQFLRDAKASDHGITSRAGQRFRTALMVDRIVGRLHHAHPEVRVLTLHDALVVTLRHAELARTTIESEFKAAIWIAPKIKTTPWGA
jgi:hypothetical protein